MIYQGDRFEGKVEKLAADGLDNLLVVADFDRTLTPSMHNGRHAANSYQVLFRSGVMSAYFAQKMDELFSKYHPIEIDPRLTIEQKTPLIVEWWMAVFDLMKECGYSRQKLEQIIASGTLHWRDGVKEFLDKLAAAGLPLLIFSAGMGDIIVESLKAVGADMRMIDVIANFSSFDDEGAYLGTKEPVVHSLDKNEGLLDVFGLRIKFAGRANVLLLGDSMQDLDMIKGDNHQEVLKLGYLNHATEDTRLKYRQAFDMVVEGDGDFQPVNELVERIFRQ